jgi:microcystin-dependent protein
MSQPYLGEIRMFAGNFPPAGWTFCEGQLLPISENDALFQLLGTTYGGDGEHTFKLPDMRGRVPLHHGTGPGGTQYQVGEMEGVEQVTLSIQQIPSHSHSMTVSEAIANVSSPENATLAISSQATAFTGYSPGNTSMHLNTVATQGGNQPHSNLQPFLCISFIISLYGIFPSQT